MGGSGRGLISCIWFLMCRVYLHLNYVGCIGNRILRIGAPSDPRLHVAMPLKPQESSTGVRLQAMEYSVLISCCPFRALYFSLHTFNQIIYTKSQ